MTEIEAESIAQKSQNLVNKRFNKIGTKKLFVVTHISKNLETDSETNWMVLVTFKHSPNEKLDNSLVENINYFLEKYRSV